MYQYILFDLDGTLTDPREGITKSVQYALQKMGIDEPDLRVLEHFIGPPLRSEFMQSYGFSETDAEQATAFYRERFSVRGWSENVLFDGVHELLTALRANGRQLAIASSKPSVFVSKILDLFDLTQYFDVIAGAALDGSIDTKAQVVAIALDRLHVEDKTASVLVGDRFHDVEGAAENGIDCIGVTFGFGGAKELQQAGAVRIVDSMQALRGVLLHGE